MKFNKLLCILSLTLMTSSAYAITVVNKLVLSPSVNTNPNLGSYVAVHPNGDPHWYADQIIPLATSPDHPITVSFGGNFNTSTIVEIEGIYATGVSYEDNHCPYVFSSGNAKEISSDATITLSGDIWTESSMPNYFTIKNFRCDITDPGH